MLIQIRRSIAFPCILSYVMAVDVLHNENDSHTCWLTNSCENEVKHLHLKYQGDTFFLGKTFSSHHRCLSLPKIIICFVSHLCNSSYGLAELWQDARHFSLLLWACEDAGESHSAHIRSRKVCMVFELNTLCGVGVLQALLACNLAGLQKPLTRHTVSAGLVSYLHSIPTCSMSLAVLWSSNWSVASPFKIQISAPNTSEIFLTCAYSNAFMVS
jgi:hypothetical protein